MVKVTDKQFYMSNMLKGVLNSYCYNLKDDWDFVIVITGSGQVRVGKSVLAQQIGYYISQKMGTPFDITNLCFTGKELMEKAHQSPMNSVLIYDEARNALDAKKTMRGTTQELLDFFAECGQYNNVIILVMPDFFELSKTIALNRSRILLDVYTRNVRRKDKEGGDVVKFERGYFKFFDYDRKRILYLKGKEQKHNYHAVKPLFRDNFPNVHTVDEEAYRLKKLQSIKKGKEERKDKFKMSTGAYSNLLKEKVNMPYTEQANLLKGYGFSISSNRLSEIAKEIRESLPEHNYNTGEKGDISTLSD